MIWKTEWDAWQWAWFIDRRGLEFLSDQSSTEEKKEGTPGQLKNKFSNLRKYDV